MKPYSLAVVGGVVALLLSALDAAAQAPKSTLFTPPANFTETQRITANAITSACVRQGEVPNRSADLQDLYNRCNEIVPNLLGLSDAGLADAVGKIAPGEATGFSTTITQPGARQFKLLAPRLATLRLGGGGLSMNMNLDGKAFASTGTNDRSDAGGDALAANPPTGPAGRLGLFLNGNGSFGEKDSTSREVGFDFDQWGLLAGADYRVTDNVVLGVAFNYSKTSADFHGALGDTDTRSYGGLLYGTYYRGAFYADAHTGFNWNKFDVTRRIVYESLSAAASSVDRTAKGDTEGPQYTAGLGAGYDFRAGPVTITPYGRVEYIHLDIDGYTERGAEGLNLTVRKQDVDSFQSALGATLAYSFSLPFGVLVPQIHGEWRHEFLNNDRAITAKYAADPFNTFFAIPTDRPDRDFFAVGAGLSLVLAPRVSAFFNYETILGLRDVTHHDFWAGVRVEF